ncbi:MAG: PilZ domain-containing protein [Oligoflexia bacterium]|nr:PilZ domain-containing protein [Oligoflexia bacterium]
MRRSIAQKPERKAAKGELPSVYLIAGGGSPFLFRQLEHWLRYERAHPCQFFSSGIEFIKRVENYPSAALVIFYLGDKSAFLDLDQMVKLMQAMEWSWSSRIIVLNGFDHPAIRNHLVSLGCFVSDLASSDLRMTKLRIERHLNALDQGLSDGASNSVISGKGASLPKFKVRWTESLLLADDCWFIPTERFIYKTQKTWMVSLVGSRSSGNWKKVGSHRNGVDECWHWQAEKRQASSAKAEPAGQWEFWGIKPEYYANRWTFAGNRPRLHFIREDGKTFTRFYALDARTIVVAPNSVSAASLVTIRRKETLEAALPPAGSLFKPVADPRRIEAYLKRAWHEQRIVKLWRGSSSQPVSGRIIALTEGASPVLRLQDRESMTAFMDVRNSAGKIMGNFGYRAGTLFFSAHVTQLGDEENLLGLALEGGLYRVQRRIKQRFFIQNQADIRATIDGHERLLIDLGMGGLGFCLRRREASPYEVGQVLSVKLGLFATSLDIAAEVRWIREVALRDGVKTMGVGLRFLKLDTLSASYLQLLLFDLCFDRSTGQEADEE